MAYVTGQATSFADLLLALKDALVANGWTLQASGATYHVVSKGTAFLRFEDITIDANTPQSLMLTGATGYSAGALVQPSNVTPRMGRAHNNAAAYVWPMTYHIHIGTTPDEVYMVANWSIDYFMWLAFGVSNVPGLAGTGMWISANSMRYYCTGYLNNLYSYTMGPDSGGSATGYYSYYRNTGLFWNTYSRYGAGTVASYAAYYQEQVHTNLNPVLSSNGWGGVPTAIGVTAVGKICAIQANKPHMSREPSVWSGEATLMPIQAYEWTDSNKCQMVVDVRHARYVRLDTYMPGDVITLGTDKWKVYPFFKKYTVERDCGDSKEHSGTFGMAIRYDGP
jgi:hypothetical protein